MIIIMLQLQSAEFYTFSYHLGDDCCPFSLENAYKFLGSLSFGT